MKIIEKQGKRKRVYTKNDSPSLTDQSFKAETDANSVIKKYLRDGTWPNPKLGTYADLSNIPDLQTALDTINKANSSFAELPSHLRKRFGNDPQKLVEFIQDPKNINEAITLGILNKRDDSNDAIPKNSPNTTSSTDPENS